MLMTLYQYIVPSAKVVKPSRLKVDCAGLSLLAFTGLEMMCVDLIVTCIFNYDRFQCTFYSVWNLCPLILCVDVVTSQPRARKKEKSTNISDSASQSKFSVVIFK